MTSFDLSFDYRCPSRRNIHLHVVTALRAARTSRSISCRGRSVKAAAVRAPTCGTTRLRRRSALVAAGIRCATTERVLPRRARSPLSARHDRAIRLVTLDEISNVLAPLGVDMAKVAADVASRRPTT